MAIRKPQPDASRLILTCRHELCLRRRLCQIHALYCSGLIYPDYPSILGPDPKIGAAVLEQADDPRAVQARSIGIIEFFKMHAIESRQPIERTHPKISIMRLNG